MHLTYIRWLKFFNQSLEFPISLYFPLVLPFLYRFLKARLNGLPTVARGVRGAAALLIETSWVQKLEFTLLLGNNQ